MQTPPRQSISETVLNIFPKLFYSTPTLPPQRIKISERDILLGEPMDCILWTVELLTDAESTCLQATVEQIVKKWYPPKSKDRISKYNFSKPINKLVSKGFLESRRVSKNRRKSELRLTPTGRQLLNYVKQTRTQAITEALQLIAPEAVAAVLPLLEQIADAVWENRKQAAKAT
jgi:DNA-binding HxlR family transcriptional regulator